jgi:UDPglucose--hexose-1-phosphate uridylyltransferase
MPELRRDPLSEGWVIISTERGKRPSDYGRVREHRKPGPCVFCEGQEAAAPVEIWALRDGTPPGGPGWRVRVIPNKFAALRVEGNLDRRGEGQYDRMNGIGAHEVIIETPNHDETIMDMSVERVAEVMLAYRSRIEDLRKDDRFKYVQVFKNHGEVAGASQPHAHSQVIALPVTPRWVKEELISCRKHFEAKERCLFCDIINQELDLPKRIAYQNDQFVAFLPFASRFPFETMILPKQHESDFTRVDDAGLRSIADCLKTVLMALDDCLEDPPFNYVLHSASVRRPGRGYWQSIDYDYHWHLEIIPRLTKMAGFEWGTGFYINPTPPEEACAHLRRSVARVSGEKVSDETPASPFDI